MRTVPEHRDAALALVRPTPVTSVPIDAADGHVLAEDVVAPCTLPRWDDSAMDGYAVRSADIASASARTPVHLTVVGDLPAGSSAGPVVRPGTAVRIMTGGLVPPGADAVVPVERTDGGTEVVRIDAPAGVGDHVRRAGEDVREGAL